MNYEAMDAETVASLLGISDRQLRNYCKDGCPYDQRGKSRIFAWPRVLEWYVGYKSGAVLVPDDTAEPDEASPTPGKPENLQQATLRKTRAEADLKALTLSRQRGQVIDIATARRIVDRLFGNLKAQLLGAAPTLNTRLEGEPDSIAREAAIRTFMEDLCRELATGKIVGGGETETPNRETTDTGPETEDDDPDTVTGLQAAADPTDDDVNQAVVEFLAASAALDEAQRAD